MSSLIIVTAGGLARETLEAVRAQGRYDPIGFVDDDPGRQGERIRGVEVLGGLGLLDAHPDTFVALCAGGGATRSAIATRLGLVDSRYATVIHPSVHVPPSCRIGPGSVLLAGVVLTTAVSVGRHVVVMPNATMTHDDVVQDFATLCAGVQLGGAVSIGQRAYLGMGSTVRHGGQIGADATVGMGTVVLGDVPSGETWVGNPARPIRTAAAGVGEFR